MKCTVLRENGRTVVACTRRGRPRERCDGSTCSHAPAVAYCDWPLAETDVRKTCSRALCAKHRTPVGEKDLCPPHAEQLQPSLFGTKT